MDLWERMNHTEFMGREFLTWLWFKSEERDGMFPVAPIGEVGLWLDDRVTLKSDSDEAPETVVCSGENSDLKEARFALAEGKKITQARFRMEIAENEWSFTLESAALNVRSMRPPRVVVDTREDPEGLFFERVKLLELAISALDGIFFGFVKMRLSDEWEAKEVPAIARWIREGLGSLALQ